jgi:hypothetical protein
VEFVLVLELNVTPIGVTPVKVSARWVMATMKIPGDLNVRVEVVVVDNTDTRVAPKLADPDPVCDVEIKPAVG